MKILLCAWAAVFIALSATTARAADISGNWVAEMQAPGGETMQVAFTFEQDRALLSGSVQGPQGDAVAISDGKVDGDRISFKVAFDGRVITHDGAINAAGDEIKLSTKSESADFPAKEMTLRRAKMPLATATFVAPERFNQQLGRRLGPQQGNSA